MHRRNLVIGLFVGVLCMGVGCDAFVGPVTAPEACPVRCSTGTCCPDRNTCVAGEKCRPDWDGPFGVQFKARGAK